MCGVLRFVAFVGVVFFYVRCSVVCLCVCVRACLFVVSDCCA